MAPLLFAALGQFVLGFLLFVTSAFMILLVLVQRGRGGGLTGALGGVGGQSAFGTKAGDLFTKVTVVVACFWILLCMLTIITLNGQAGFQDTGRATGSSGMESGESGAGDLEAPATGKGADAKGTTKAGTPASDGAKSGAAKRATPKSDTPKSGAAPAKSGEPATP